MQQKKWWHHAVVYQVYPRSFYDSNDDGVGDLAGIIAKLDYLAGLGIELIWLSPVYQSPMDDNGYDISDYQNIAAEFGTLAEMDELIAEAGRRGIRILMDLVVNHTSDEHPWFIEARKTRDNPLRDFYIWRPARADGSPPDAQRSYFGGSAWQWDEASGEYYYHLFSRRQPDLNWENPGLRREVYRMMNWWLERGIGGFRMDVVDLLGKQVDRGITSNGPELHSILQEMNRATFGSRDVLTVGEAWSATPAIAKQYSDPARAELSMVFQFEHISQTFDPEAGKWKPRPFDLPAFKRCMAKWQTALDGEGWNSLFWNNHDLPRAVSKFGDPGRYRVESAKMLATALHGLKGTPYVYQGEEIGMTNVRFPAIEDYRDLESLNLYRERTAAGMPAAEMMKGIYQNGRDNARTPMQWSGAAYGGFSHVRPWLQANPNYAQINVEAALNDPDSIFFHYQRLIRLRKESELLVYGDFVLLLEEHAQVFAYLRRLGGQALAVVSNFSGQCVECVLPVSLRDLDGESLISNYAPRERLGQTVSLQPYESFIFAFRCEDAD
ncbi:glycoside hydrolase family 13 protein [Paludibacterium yongneupense]|uniref:glycoside hydrolase family 13 protein n=1 Tax=Paludibacterium yongneupense TaxID=400061 RepID=UPI00041531D1|nr:alpha-glucosidase [Paludibacterium yongneupense]